MYIQYIQYLHIMSASISPQKKSSQKKKKTSDFFVIRINKDWKEKIQYLVEKKGQTDKSSFIRSLVEKEYEETREKEKRMKKTVEIPSFSLNTPKDITFTKDQIYGDYFDSEKF